MLQATSDVQSRSGTSGQPTRLSSHLLFAPALRTARSVSSLHGTPTTGEPFMDRQLSSHMPSPSIDSSASSSILNMPLDSDDKEGILVQDIDTEIEIFDGDENSATGQPDRVGTDEDSRKMLRDQLRKTLNKRQATSSPERSTSQMRQKGKASEIDGLVHEPVGQYPPREYFVLTDAGKPVFISRPDNGDMDDLTAAIGITQAIISVFLDDGDKLRCINAGRTRITFLLRAPLYYVCVSSWGEPESVTRAHLEYLHLQILSIVSATQLKRIFERRTNFDLRRLLNGAEGFLMAMLSQLELDFAINISSLHCLRLDSALRGKIAETLVPSSKMKDILYVILVTCGRVVTLVRPKRHSIHPSDIHILLNTIYSPSILSSPASASWIPICLPKYNPSGFVHAYISFLRQANQGDLRNGPVLVCISGGGEFDPVRAWCDVATQKLASDGTLASLTRALQSGTTEYTASELAIPGLLHFVYKARAHVQITAPVFEEPYNNINDQRRVITLYQILYDAIHGKSGQESPLKMQYIRTERESVMGWITQMFELYIMLSPKLPKSAAVHAANSVARWVKAEESRLFLRDAPVF